MNSVNHKDNEGIQWDKRGIETGEGQPKRSEVNQGIRTLEYDPTMTEKRRNQTKQQMTQSGSTHVSHELAAVTQGPTVNKTCA